MKFSRRHFFQLAAGAAAPPATSRFAWAQTYPSRPVRIIVGYPAGGAADTIARLIAQSLFERFRKPFIIDNRPGAAGNIAAEAVTRAAPDGYTLLLINVNDVYNATFYDKLNFNLIRDIAPVGSIDRSPWVMEVNPSFPAKTIPEFIAYAKANPRKITYGSTGIGTGPHVSVELLKMLSGIELIHVPYRGSAPELTDLIAGQVQMVIDPITSSIEYIRAGKVRALAVTTANRLDILPGVPSLGDFLPGYEASGWAGLCAPKNTPVEIIDRLNKEINAIIADAKMIERFDSLGITPMAMTPAEFGKLIADETEKWGKVIRAANIKAE
jgi:tripartite-type tricarboxylate transporter receptor subunit TctC